MITIKLKEKDITFAALKLIEQLYIDKSNESIVAPEETDGRLDDVYQMAVTLATTMKNIRTDGWEAIVDDLMNSEPWCKYPSIKNKLLKYDK